MCDVFAGIETFGALAGSATRSCEHNTVNRLRGNSGPAAFSLRANRQVCRYLPHKQGSEVQFLGSAINHHHYACLIQGKIERASKELVLPESGEADRRSKAAESKGRGVVPVIQGRAEMQLWGIRPKVFGFPPSRSIAETFRNRAWRVQARLQEAEGGNRKVRRNVRKLSQEKARVNPVPATNFRHE